MMKHLLSEERMSSCLYCARHFVRMHGSKTHFPLDRNISVTGLQGSQVRDTDYQASGTGWNGSVRENGDNIK